MHTFFSCLNNQPITDIVKVGFVDMAADCAEVSFMDRYLFMEFGSFFLKFTSVEQYSLLKIEIVPQISFDFETDEDLRKAKASVATLILTDNMADNRIVRINVYGPENHEGHHVVCKAISLILVCGQELFIDPSYYFGLNVGGADQKQKWVDNIPAVPQPVQLNITHQ